MMTTTTERDGLWAEYDAAADRLAADGRRWVEGDAVPADVAADVAAAIEADPDAFAERVRGAAYAQAMAGVSEEA